MCKYFRFTLFHKRRETKIIPFDWPTDNKYFKIMTVCLQMFMPSFAEILVARNGDKIKEKSEIVVQPKFYNIISWSPELIIISTIFCVIHKKKKASIIWLDVTSVLLLYFCHMWNVCCYQISARIIWLCLNADLLFHDFMKSEWNTITKTTAFWRLQLFKKLPVT